MIKQLSSLRFIFAILIMLHHSRIDGVRISEPAGPLGVTFFLILSGFVMSLGYYNKVLATDFSWKNFIWKRLIRVYPLHVICLLLYLASTGYSVWEGQLVKLVSNLFLLQSWLPQTAMSGNPVSWCLSDLLFFYAIYPILIKFSEKYKQYNGLFVLTAIITYAMVAMLIPSSKTHYVLYICPIFRLFDFYIGVCLYNLYVTYKENRKVHIFIKKYNPVIETCLLLMVVGTFYLYGLIPIAYGYVLINILPVSTCVLYFSLNSTNNGLINKILQTKFLVSCGAFSFTFYMLHVLLIWIERDIVRNYNISINGYALWIITFLCILLISWIVYNKIEQPITNKLKNIKI